MGRSLWQLERASGTPLFRQIYLQVQSAAQAWRRSSDTAPRSPLVREFADFERAAAQTEGRPFNTGHTLILPADTFSLGFDVGLQRLSAATDHTGGVTLGGVYLQPEAH